MAGKRQHYLPRLLQRGFLANPRDEGERTWLHRRGASPKLVGIRDIGVEDWFYSRKAADGTPTLDDVITDYERDLSNTVTALRQAASGTIISSFHAAETVVHLVVRAAHLRNMISSGISSLTREIEALFTDPVRLGRMIGITGPTLSEAIGNAVRETAAKLVPVGIPAALSERLMSFLVREFGDQLVSDIAAAIGPLIANVFGDVTGRVRDAHNKMLQVPVVDNGWIAEMAKLEWTVERGEDLILPDAIALSRACGEQLGPLLFTNGADAELVVMPIAVDRILVGQRRDVVFDISTFNADAAAASESFFISARPMGGAGLIERIGTGPTETLERTIADVITEAENARQLPGCDIPPAQPEERITQDFSYSVRLVDFGDAMLAKEIADVVQIVVGTLARDLPLQDLDGFTIAVDYEAALTSLDRGDPDLPPATTGALGYGLGVAKPVTVRRDGIRKEHLVVAAGLAETWISSDAEIRAFGLHKLVKMLAGIAHATRYTSASEIRLMPDAMVRELHLAVATTPASYWAAREAAFVASAEGETYSDSVIESLDFAERTIADARGRMKDPSDVGPTAMLALECVAAILGHAADWLGHRDGLADGEAFAGSDLPERLAARGLDRWITIFGRDLAACYGPDGTLELSVVMTLSRHVERLFWSLGVYCWPEGEGVRCIVSDQPYVPPHVPITGAFS